MANYHLTKRLEIIIHLLDNYPYLSKKSILERLEDDYEMRLTTRTLERDFQKLAMDFGIELAYDRGHNGYYIEEQDRERVASFLKFMGLVHLGELFKEGFTDFGALQEAVALEDHSRFKGIELIRPLLLAIKQQRTVSFVHENYIKNTLKDYEISPLQLKEYNNRWYVVGLPKGESHIKTFGIDRIEHLKPQGLSPIKKETYQAQLGKFNKVIGLNYNASEKPELIELHVSQRQYKYLESLPLHPSQEKVGLTENNWVRLQLYLIINYEFKMQLLKLGAQIEVVSPKWLRRELKSILKQTLNLYRDE